MKTLLILSFLLIGAHSLLAQNGISINTDGAAPHSSAMLDIKSTDKGMLVPRLTEAQRNAIASPATGLLLYQTDNTSGFYYYNGTAWTLLSTSTFTETDPKVATTTTGRLAKWNGTNLVDGLLFDDGTNVGLGTASPADKLHVVGKLRIDAGKIDFRNTGQSVFIGQDAGLNDDLTNNANSFVGYEAGKTNTTGFRNTALGSGALFSNTTGNYNNAMGGNALRGNTTGYSNNAIGDEALMFNTTGYENIAIGDIALRNNTTGSESVAIGTSALTQNTTGILNVGIGKAALRSNTTGTANSAIGYNSLSKNTIGQYNVGFGGWALRENIVGNNNTALGYSAGYGALGSGNVFIGYNTGYNETGSNKLYIDNSSTATPLLYGEFDTNLLRINGTLNVNNAYSLPTVAGTANQYLQTNGAGVTSWVTPSFLSTESDPKVGTLTTNYLPKWNGTSLANGNLFDDGTNVGLGTASPADKLHVVGKLRIDAGKIDFRNTGESVFIGENAGLNDDLTNNQNVFIGKDAGMLNTTGNLNTFVGHASGTTNSTGIWNTGIGQNALGANTIGNYNTSLGRSALGNNTTGSYNTVLGQNALATNTIGSNNIAIGQTALGLATSSDKSIAIGVGALGNSTNSIQNIAIGHQAGNNNLIGSDNIFLGFNAGYSETGSNKLYIDNSNTAFPLIYGEFDNNLLRVNGTLNINNAYNLPTTDGTANQFLQTNGAGTASWVTPSFLSTESDPKVGTLTTNYLPKWNGTSLANGLLFDNGTNVGLGTASPADKLHVVGKLRIDAGKIDFRNTGNSVFIGEEAGNVDNLTDNRNVFVGYRAGSLNTTGDHNTFVGSTAGEKTTTGVANVALGSVALLSNTTGSDNVALGHNALSGSTSGNNNIAIGTQALFNVVTTSNNIALGYNTLFNNTSGNNNLAIGVNAGNNNSTGSNNIFLGYNAGYNETGSNKLYIDNSNTASPLIWGDFATNLLRINGTLNVNNAYSLPTVAGTNGFVLQTNGAGVTSWVNPTSLSITETDPQVAVTTTGRLARWNGTSLVDGLLFDNGTNVGLGTALPVDKLHVVGNARIDAGRLDFRNTGESVFVGQDAGLNDDFTNNENVFIGIEAGKATVIGERNVAIGSYALKANTSSFNTAVGFKALDNNTTGTTNTALGNFAGNNSVGSQNVFLGAGAGENANTSNSVFIGSEVGSSVNADNILYIDNSAINTPLIYGEFDNDLLRINGTLNINNEYSLPTNAGSANQILQTNGAGATSWVTPSFLSTESDPKVGTLTTNYLPKWNGTSLANGLLFDNGTNVGIGTASPTTKFHVYNGDGRLDRGANTAGVGRVFTINGARSGQGSNFAQLNFENYDNNNGLIDYVGASIGSQNTGSIDAGDLRFSTYNGTLTERMIISKDGYIGIGTSTPTQAQLVVNGSQNFTTAYGYLNSTGSTGSIGSSANAYSIYASARVAASEFNAFSDARIKKVKGVSNNAKDLATLANIRITDYTHIDSIAKGNKEIKKVIAQELKTVYPQAVSIMTDVIPDIYQTATITEGGLINLPTNLKVGEKVKLILPTGEELVEVTGIEATGFRVNSNKVGKVFVYGRQVNDFHTVDYEALTTLNISATQELLKKIEALEKENQEMKTVKAEVTDLKKQMQDIQLLLQQQAKR